MSDSKSKFVINQATNGVIVPYHTVTQRFGWQNMSEEERREFFYYSDQDDEAIRSFVLKKPKYLNMTIAPTWACNLRCSHCFVLHQLSGTMAVNSDLVQGDQLESFILRFVEYYQVDKVSIDFVGGEPTLASRCVRECSDALDRVAVSTGIGVAKSMVTNAVFDPGDDDVMNVLRRMDVIRVSIDGDRSDHNAQRRSATGVSDPYLVSVKNLYHICRLIGPEKVIVQAVIDGKKLSDKQYVFDMRYLFGSMGIKQRNIFIGIRSPNGYGKNADDEILTSISDTTPKARQCCAYRFMSNLVVDGSGVHASFHRTKDSLLGKLSDSIDQIAERHRCFIESEYPILNDKRCMSCEAIGICWGTCVQNETLNLPPSEMCDQNGMINKKRSLNGTDFFAKTLGCPGKCGNER